MADERLPDAEEVETAKRRGCCRTAARGVGVEVFDEPDGGDDDSPSLSIAWYIVAEKAPTLIRSPSPRT